MTAKAFEPVRHPRQPVRMTVGEKTGLAGVVATATVAAFGYAATLWSGRQDRRHAWQLARDERIFDAWRTAYEDVLRVLQRRLASLDRSYSLAKPTASDPRATDDEMTAALVSKSPSSTF